MHGALQSQSAAAMLAKAYKKALVTLHATHLDENSAVQQARAQLLATYEQQLSLRSKYSFRRAFAKLRTVLAERADQMSAGRSKAVEQLRGGFTDTYEHMEQYGSGTPQGSSVSTAATEAVDLAADKSTMSANLQQVYGKDGLLRQIVLAGVGSASRAFMTSLNHTEVEGLEVMEAALRRAPGTPLITVCNHVAAMDDPLVVASIIPPDFVHKPQSLRWTLCATDRCFKYAALVPFFRAAKVLPIHRGGGMSQQGMAAAEELLGRGEWVHIFPEGTRARDPTKIAPIRKGIGRLVASCREAGASVPPVVVPFVHSGMEDVMPRGRVVPATGKKVRIVVGEPVPVGDLLAAASLHGWADDALYCAIADRIGHAMRALRARLDGDVALAEAEARAAAPGTISYSAAAATAGHGHGHAGGSGHGSSVDPALVSGLDLFDYADLAAPGHIGSLVSRWEGAAFKMWHRGWLMRGYVADTIDAARAQYSDMKARMRARRDRLYQAITTAGSGSSMAPGGVASGSSSAGESAMGAAPLPHSAAGSGGSGGRYLSGRHASSSSSSVGTPSRQAAPHSSSSASQLARPGSPHPSSSSSTSSPARGRRFAPVQSPADAWMEYQTARVAAAEQLMAARPAGAL